MSKKDRNVKKDRDGRWRYRIMGTYADGTTTKRISGTAPKDDNTKTAAKEAMAKHLARMRFEAPPPDAASQGNPGDPQENTTQTTQTTARIEAPGSLPAAPPKPLAPTIAEFAPTYLASCKLQNKPLTMQTKEGVLKYIVALVGNERLDALDAPRIERFRIDAAALRNTRRSAAERTLAPASVNNVLKIFRNLLTVAKTWGHITVVPRVAKVRQPKARFDFLNFAEVTQLLDACDPIVRLMVLVCVRTGLRRGEMAALHRDRVTVTKRSLFVTENYVETKWGPSLGPPKNGKDREIPLSDELCAALEAHIASHPHGRLFCDADGEIFRIGVALRMLHAACKRAGLRLIGWRTLRHTFASHLAMRGVPLKAISDLMGHADIKMTMTYAHLSPGLSREAVQLLDARPNPGAASGLATDWQKSRPDQPTA